MWTFRTCRKGSSSLQRQGSCRRLSTSALSAHGWRWLRGWFTTSALRQLWGRLTTSALCAHGWRRLWRRLTISALSDLSAHGWRRWCGRLWRLTTNSYVSGCNSLRVVFWRRLNAFDGAVTRLATLDGTGCIFLFFFEFLLAVFFAAFNISPEVHSLIWHHNNRNDLARALEIAVFISVMTSR